MRLLICIYLAVLCDIMLRALLSSIVNSDLVQEKDGNAFQTKMGFSKMRNSVEKFNFLQDKTWFSLQLGDSRLQLYNSQSHSRLTQ